MAISGVADVPRWSASLGVGARTASVVAIAVKATRPTAPPIIAAGREKTLWVASGMLVVEFDEFMGWLLPEFS
jgi:hypothetical protein